MRADKADVWRAVEEFRDKYPELKSLPVDILTLIEVRLGIDVIPFERLFEKYSVDAAVLPDFSGIYVDKKSYRYLEGRPPSEFNRLRFILAHELGHIVLNRELAQDLKFETLEDFWRWTRQYQETCYGLEWEAKEFGGRLLVPIESLKSKFDKFVSGVEKEFPEWLANPALREALTKQLGETYAVSPSVIAIRLDREDLWPAA